MLKFLKLFCVAVLAWLLTACANERAITGGAEDTTAPYITMSSPSNESIRVPTETKIVIRFSEQMKKSSLASALQIWPRPPGGYRLKTGWTWLKVTFNEPLVKNETYLITLDKSAQDLRGNGLASTYMLGFSTGEEINSGSIAGRVESSPEVRKKGKLYLYKDLNTSLDTLRQQPADYIFQGDDAGEFKLAFLKQRSHVLFFHWDKNHNSLFDAGDYFGRPAPDYVRAADDSAGVQYHIWPRELAPERLKLLGITDLGNNLYTFRTDRIPGDSIGATLEVHSGDRVLDIRGISRIQEDETGIRVQLADSIQAGDPVWLSGYATPAGICLQSDTLAFALNENPDTLYFDNLKIAWANGEQERYPSESTAITISSELPFSLHSDSLFRFFVEPQDTLPLPGNLVQLSSMQWQYIPAKPVDTYGSHSWKLPVNALESPFSTAFEDSVLSGSLISVPGDSLGSITLMQMGVESISAELISSRAVRKFILAPGTSTTLDELPALSYSLIGYIDGNGNGQYDAGGFDVEDGAESFWVYPDPIPVRVRWDTNIGIWTLK